MPVKAAPKALLGLRRPHDTTAARTAIDEHLVAMITQHTLGSTTAKGLYAIGKEPHHLGVFRKPVSPPNELGGVLVPSGRLCGGVNGPTRLRLHRIEEPRVVVPDVRREFGLVVVVHGRIAPAA
jgi:hypothetical protein